VDAAASTGGGHGTTGAGEAVARGATGTGTRMVSAVTAGAADGVNASVMVLKGNEDSSK
jgi:hypothetical protein